MSLKRPKLGNKTYLLWFYSHVRWRVPQQFHRKCHYRIQTQLILVVLILLLKRRNARRIIVFNSETKNRTIKRSLIKIDTHMKCNYGLTFPSPNNFTGVYLNFWQFVHKKLPDVNLNNRIKISVSWEIRH